MCFFLSSKIYLILIVTDIYIVLSIYASHMFGLIKTLGVMLLYNVIVRKYICFQFQTNKPRIRRDCFRNGAWFLVT